MGRSRKFDYQASIESELAAAPDGLSLDDLLARCGLKVDRSTLFRHLTHLIEIGRVERTGNARASRYRARRGAGADTLPAPAVSRQISVQQAPEFTDRQLPNGAPGLPPAEGRPLREAGGAVPDAIPATAPEYEAVVKKAVRTIVREWKRCSPVNLQIYLSLLVQPEQLDRVAAAVAKELTALHEGDLDRFGLTPEEFRSFIPPDGREAAGAGEGSPGAPPYAPFAPE
jgi:hypothetical protein